MLKILWLVDALLLIAALAIAIFSTGQDQAGRAIVWFFPIAMALLLLASFGAGRLGLNGIATIVAAVAPLVAVVVIGTSARSFIEQRRNSSGASYWTDPALRRMATAIVAGDTAAIRVAAREADINAVGKDNMTPLTFAIGRQPSVVPALLSAGADAAKVVPNTLTPLAQALRAPESVFTALLNAGADANGDGDSGASILVSAIQTRSYARYAALIAHGADISKADATGRTALIVAAEERLWNIATDLINRGADVLVQSRDGASVSRVIERADENTRAEPEFSQFAQVARAAISKSSSNQRP